MDQLFNNTVKSETTKSSMVSPVAICQSDIRGPVVGFLYRALVSLSCPLIPSLVHFFSATIRKKYKRQGQKSDLN